MDILYITESYSLIYCSLTTSNRFRNVSRFQGMIILSEENVESWDSSRGISMTVYIYLWMVEITS